MTIYFALPDENKAPPAEQIKLQADISDALTAVQTLYIKNEKPTEPFRLYYIRLYELARLGLTGGKARPGVAQLALQRLIGDLIKTEGPPLKNARLKKLAGLTAKFGLFLLGL